jgi:hypothetical protein
VIPQKKKLMANYTKGLNTGRNNKGFYANRPKSDGMLGTSFGQSSSNAKSQQSFDKGYSKGRSQRRSNQSCFKNFFE